MHKAVAPGVKQNVLAVGSPSGNVFLGGMIGEATRHSASGGNDVDIAIAVVLAGKSDHRAIGREIRESLDANAGGEAMGIAALAADDP